MKLIIASNNAHKVSEIKAILGCFYDEILSLREAGIDMDVVEDANTFEGNALKKAREVFAVADADAVLSDDCNYGAAQRISGHAHYGRIALEVCNEAVAYCVKVDTPYYQHQHHAGGP